MFEEFLESLVAVVLVVFVSFFSIYASIAFLVGVYDVQKEDIIVKRTVSETSSEMTVQEMIRRIVNVTQRGAKIMRRN